MNIHECKTIYFGQNECMTMYFLKKNEFLLLCFLLCFCLMFEYFNVGVIE